MRPGSRQHGFTILAVLAALVFVALATQGVMVVLSQQAQREREAELLRVGPLIARAIADYRRLSPGAVKTWPQSLDELTGDRRFVDMRRHLRQVYEDPVTRSVEWGLILADDGGVMGVYSKSEEPPIRTAALSIGSLALPAASRYSDWKFVAPRELEGQGP